MSNNIITKIEYAVVLGRRSTIRGIIHESEHVSVKTYNCDIALQDVDYIVSNYTKASWDKGVDYVIMYKLFEDDRGNIIFKDQIYKRYLNKDVPYGARIKDKVTKTCLYNFILTSLINEFAPTAVERANLVKLRNKLDVSQQYKYEDNVYLSILRLFGENAEDVLTGNISLDIIQIIDETNLDIFYSDGSFKKATSTASYATVKVLNIPIDSQTPLHEELTKTDRNYVEIAGKLNNSTNNIGELTGIHEAIKLFGSKDIQVIISDSEYSIKIFREWIYNWKQNNFKGSNGKEVLNKDLVQKIDNSLLHSKKLVLYKWTKGHDNNPFNELCDKLAKEQLGIEKK